MNAPWKVIRFRVEPGAGPKDNPCAVETVLAETGERATAEICCEALHRILGRRRSEAWYIQAPDGRRFQMARQDAVFEEVQIGGAPPPSVRSLHIAEGALPDLRGPLKPPAAWR